MTTVYRVWPKTLTGNTAQGLNKSNKESSMYAMEIMTSFANAILAMESAVRVDDEAATAKAIAEIVRVWSLETDDGHAITAIISSLRKALEELDIDRAV